MKNFYSLIIIVLSLCFSGSSQLFSQTTIASYNFNTDLQGWTAAGNDAGTVTDAAWACEAAGSVFSKDDDTSNNRLTSPTLDFSSYQIIDLTLCHKATTNLDSGEGFIVEYNNGSGWTTVATFNRDTHFSGVGSGEPHNLQVTLDNATYAFTNNSKFRLSGTANADDEYNVFDDVLIEGRDVTYSNVTVSVDWPLYAYENSVYIYAPDGTLIDSIIGTGNSYNTTINLGCLEDLSNYYFVMYDTYGDGWNGTDNITITSSGNTVVSQNGNFATTTGRTMFFGVYGGICGGEINVVSSGTDIVDGSTTPTNDNNTDFGQVDLGSTVTRVYTIENLGGSTLNLTAPLSPYITISGLNALDFSISVAPTNTIAAYSSTNFNIEFTPSAAGVRTATITIANDDANENPYNFTIQGTGVTPLANGPGGVVSNLKVWLKGTDGLSYTDGQSISMWNDQGRGFNATVNTAGQEPTFYDNTTQNINFNPVVGFDNNPNSPYETDPTVTPQQYLEGNAGFYTQEMFIVAIPEETVSSTYGAMDMFCGDADNSDSTDKDVSGLGWGGFTDRVDDEVITFAISGTPDPNPVDLSERGYGKAHTSTTATYSNAGIINARNNSTSAPTAQDLYYNGVNIGNGESGVPQFANVNDSRFWIGRSQAYRGSFNGRIAEIVTFSNTLNDADLTDQRNRVQSYLAVKYGITLGVNGTSQDYVDSDGTVIWDQSDNLGFNYDVAGIGRDDVANLNQKQSSSINNATDGTGLIEGILTIGLTDIYDTNNLNKTNNSNTLDDKSYLMWGNNNASLDATPNTVAVDMSAGIPGLSTPVSFLGMQRVWKVVESGSDIGEVKVSIPQNSVRNINPPGNYYMFASDTPVFDPTADYRVMTINGSNLEATYDFDGTKYITFGYAPQTIVERSVYFDGSGDYIDMDDNFDLNSGSFTISAWINRTASSANSSIVSKRDVAFTEGYDFKINAFGRLEFSVRNGVSTQTVTSNTTIPVGKWHQVAVIYDGGTANLYIDGIFDNDASVVTPSNTDQSFFVAAAGKTLPGAFFQGNIDEVRVWSTALEEDQLHFLMNQELEENANFVNGKIIPTNITKNDAASIPWSNLEGYYPMSIYTYTNTDDESNNSRQGALRNLNTVDYQTAPLPYKSTTNGDWDTNASWANGSVQNIPGSASIVDNTKTVNWNIVETSHNITMDNSSLPTANNNNRTVLSLDVKSNKLSVSGDNSSDTGNGLTVSHYLKLDGKIDLQGESQLIQTEDSDFDVTSTGTLERDQQGTRDVFTYNYWSSPVGVSNATTNNNSYTLPQVFKDGTDPNNPVNINFITNGYNGTSGSPIGIADYWIWKYSNQSGAYADWQHVRSTGSLLAGEGYTMKGVTNTSGNVTLEQNYVFEGKPNNGDISLPITAGNEYLVGNPYASAIDADKFIMDNAPTIEGPGSTTGTLYFWEHWGGGSHNLGDYQGGYATYNLSGATPAASYGTNDPLVATGGTPVKLPGRYIPVSQGFFVKSENTGTVKFNNSQRVFEKEGTSSVFVRTSSNNVYNGDNRLKIRLGFNSVNSLHRQLLVTEDTNATPGYDWGYDGVNNETQMDDLYWMVDNDKYIIQGTNQINASTILPLGLHVNSNGTNTFTVDALENVPNDLQIYIYDVVTDTYHNIKQNDFSIDLNAGEYLDRFELRFSQSGVLSTEDFEFETNINAYYSNNNNTIVVSNPKLENVKEVSLYNILGQKIISFDEFESLDLIELKTNPLSTSTYILEVKTDEGKLSKKVLVE
ncbi:LamG-like jellyroll fold domain-containing protein [Olleya aquimaris]|uniref:Putative secreted protein (Por secretion system target) n=1 Tax=Olleya aquimaris TaxID=639310 RepID=A0A327RLK3_9FLAO|nr:LamG-like jellyroll fold domain-containing protein [Olleya aquimaris]RAJ17048.1 putative secreted protein (Por secretion system target) [Olleya aquimaris]